MNRSTTCILLVMLLLCISAEGAYSCTNFIVTRGASTDGSVMITYTCDGEFHPILRRTPAEDHETGDVVEIRTWGNEVLGSVAQVPHTYATIGLINEHQLVIGETTFTGREELINPDGLLHYW